MTIQHRDHRATLAAGAARAAAGALLLTLLSATASAQMFDKPWSATPRDRAGIAVIMKQAESGLYDRRDQKGSGGGVPSLTYNTTTLVCAGSGGEATSTANSSCLILNNATGAIDVGQGADGNQGASSSNSSTVNQAETMTNALQALQPPK